MGKVILYFALAVFMFGQATCAPTSFNIDGKNVMQLSEQFGNSVLSVVSQLNDALGNPAKNVQNILEKKLLPILRGVTEYDTEIFKLFGKASNLEKEISKYIAEVKILKGQVVKSICEKYKIDFKTFIDSVTGRINKVENIINNGIYTAKAILK